MLSGLTVCHLKLGLGQDAAHYSQGLARVVACIRALHGRDGQLSVRRHRHTAVALRRLVGEQKILERETKCRKKNSRQVKCICITQKSQIYVSTGQITIHPFSEKFLSLFSIFQKCFPSFHITILQVKVIR